MELGNQSGLAIINVIEKSLIAICTILSLSGTSKTASIPAGSCGR